jgi:hypothetical protein
VRRELAVVFRRSHGSPAGVLTALGPSPGREPRRPGVERLGHGVQEWAARQELRLSKPPDGVEICSVATSIAIGYGVRFTAAGAPRVSCAGLWFRKHDWFSGPAAGVVLVAGEPRGRATSQTCAAQSLAGFLLGWRGPITGALARPCGAFAIANQFGRSQPRNRQGL